MPETFLSAPDPSNKTQISTQNSNNGSFGNRARKAIVEALYYWGVELPPRTDAGATYSFADPSFFAGLGYTLRIVEGYKTLEEFAEEVYFEPGREILIAQSNVVRYMARPDVVPSPKAQVLFPGQVLVPGQALMCPSIVSYGENGDTIVQAGLYGKRQTLEVIKGPKYFDIGPDITPPSVPRWYYDEVAEVTKYGAKGLVVVVFGRADMLVNLSFGRSSSTLYRQPSVSGGPVTLERGDTGESITAKPKRWRVETITGLVIKESLFEGANTMEFSRPILDSDDPDMDIFGNHVLVAYGGDIVFSGMLISPQVDDRKGKTISWTAVSHTYVALKSHLNPQIHQNEWDKLLPRDIIFQLAYQLGIPIRMSEEEEAILSLPFPDDEGQRNMAYDIATTTPFSVFEKLISAVGRYICAGDDGFFTVVSPSRFLSNEPVAQFKNGESEAKFTVRYKYEELAHTYSVSSERREYNEAEIARLNGFPLPIFRNMHRKVRPQEVIDGASAWRSGAAVLEMSKAIANSLNIDVEVPGWTVPKLGRVWKRSDIVAALSKVHRLHGASEDSPVRLVVGTITREYSETTQRTVLGLFQRGVFDALLTEKAPYLTKAKEYLGFEALDSIRLPETSSENMDDIYADWGEED